MTKATVIEKAKKTVQAAAFYMVIGGCLFGSGMSAFALFEHQLDGVFLISVGGLLVTMGIRRYTGALNILLD